MLTKIGALAAALLLLGLAIATPTTAGVPKVVVAEEFGATW